MKLEDLKQGWQQTIEQQSTPQNIDEVIRMLEQKTRTLDKEIKRRDFMEISIAVLLIPVWVYGIFTSVSTMQTIGCIIAIAAGLLIPYRLLAAKKVEPQKSNNVKGFLLQERQKITQQKQMLESIVWWYIAPITSAILLITLGSSVDQSGWPQITSNMYWYYLSLTVLVIGVYALNKRAAKNKFGPLLENIDKHLAQIN